MPEIRPIFSQSLLGNTLPAHTLPANGHRHGCAAAARAPAPPPIAEAASIAEPAPAEAIPLNELASPSHCPSRSRQMKTIRFIVPLVANKDWGCTNNSGFGRKSPGKALGA
jgi:hypothetical protein